MYHRCNVVIMGYNRVERIEHSLYHLFHKLHLCQKISHKLILWDIIDITEILVPQKISSTYFVRYHWHSMDTCTTEISHHLISWGIIDIAWILVLSHHITSHHITCITCITGISGITWIPWWQYYILVEQIIDFFINSW